MERPTPMIDSSEVWRQVNEEFACSHDDNEIRLRITSHGARAFYRQCVRCGQNMGQVGARTLSESEREGCNDYDEGLKDTWLKARQSRVNELMDVARSKHSGLIAEYNKWADRQRRQWDQDYDTYIRSEKWKDMRKLVLERDNYLCQGCLVNQAHDVHHRTYEHFGDELMWELVSVCRLCHERIHERAFDP